MWKEMSLYPIVHVLQSYPSSFDELCPTLQYNVNKLLRRVSRTMGKDKLTRQDGATLVTNRRLHLSGNTADYSLATNRFTTRLRSHRSNAPMACQGSSLEDDAISHGDDPFTS